MDIALPLPQVKRQISDRLAGPTYPDDDDVRAGQEAWCRLRSNATWNDWRQVGKAHVIGRHKAMIEAGANQPIGRRYNEAFGRWQCEFGFESLDKGDRARLFEVMDHLADIEVWLATLTTNQRLQLNHPNSVLRKWRAATAVPAPNAAPKPSPYAQLKEAHAQLAEENHRLAREIETGGGDLWTSRDTADDIAKVMVRKLSTHKAEQVERAMLAKLKKRKASSVS